MKRKAAIALVLCVLLPAASCQKVRERQARKEATEEILASKREFADQIEMTGEGLKLDLGAIDEHNNRINRAADKMGGKLGEALKTTTSLQTEINRVSRECVEMSEKFPDAVDWQGIDKSRDYDARREWLRSYIDINEKTLAAYGKYPRDVAARLDEIGFTGKERAEFDKGFLRSQRRTTALVRVIRQCDIDCSNIVIGILDRLEKAGDSWGWSAEEELIRFADDADTGWFEGEMERFMELADKQLKAQEDFAVMLKGE